MDKNTLLNALIIKKLKEYDSIVESKVNHLEKTVNRVVSSAFDELNAEESLDILVDELEKEYKQKLEITSSELYSLYSKSIAEKVSSIPTPKDGIDGRDGLDGKDGKDGIDGVDGTDGLDGKDYVLTEEDKEDIAELVELPDFSKEIDEKINSRTQTIRGGGGGARKLEQLKDVDLSQAQRTPEGKIIIGSSDIQSGWAHYVDTQYTEQSPFIVTNGQIVDLPNNSGAGTTTYLNGNDDLYDGSVVTPWAVGDRLAVSIRIKVKSSANNGAIGLKLDIGGNIGTILSDSRRLIRGANTEQQIDFEMTPFTLDTFVANGGQLKFEAINGNISVYDINYVIGKIN